MIFYDSNDFTSEHIFNSILDVNDSNYFTSEHIFKSILDVNYANYFTSEYIFKSILDRSETCNLGYILQTIDLPVDYR